MMHWHGGSGSIGSIIGWCGSGSSVDGKVVAFVLFFFFYFG